MEASDLMAAPGPGDGPPSLGVARAGGLLGGLKGFRGGLGVLGV